MCVCLSCVDFTCTHHAPHDRRRLPVWSHLHTRTHTHTHPCLPCVGSHAHSCTHTHTRTHPSCGGKRSPDYARVPQTPTLHTVYPHHVPLPASPAHTLSPAPHSASSNTIFFSETSLSGAASSSSVAAAASSSRPLLSSCPSINARETLHRELFEACMDLLSRYTHGMCSSVPRKNPFADFIIDRETATTWFVGQSLITIAVSHCAAKAVDRGLCRKCADICSSARVKARKETPTPASDVDSDSAASAATAGQATVACADSGSRSATVDGCVGSRLSDQRRRHQSAMDSRRVAAKPKSRAFDDIHLESVGSGSGSAAGLSFLSSSSQGDGCTCWCQGWAEVTERRPTGKTSFMVRIENALNLPCYAASSSSSSSTACDSSYAGLVRFYDPRSLAPVAQGRRETAHQTSSDPGAGSPAALMQRSHAASSVATSSTNQGREAGAVLPPPPDSADSGITSAGSSFRRTSSSPEMEHNRLKQFEEAEVEEAKEARDDDQTLGQSPTKGLARTVSLGKAEMSQRPASSSPSAGNPVTRASSFSSKGKLSSCCLAESESSLSSPISKVPSEAALSGATTAATGTSMTSSSGSWSRGANKKSLTISLEDASSVSTRYSNGGTSCSPSPAAGVPSPTKSSCKQSPKSPPPPGDQVAGLMSQSDSQTCVQGGRQREASGGGGVGHSGSSSPASQRERSHTFSANTLNKKPGSYGGSQAGAGSSVFAYAGHASAALHAAGHAHRHPSLQQRHSSLLHHHHPDTHTKATGLSPSFFFLRLFYNPSFSHYHHQHQQQAHQHESEAPILLPSGSESFAARNIRLLDLLTPFETHKIGVIYVAPGQRTRDEILRNEHGSLRYQAMLAKIANLVRLKDVDQQVCFIGGLDNDSDLDGKYAYCWADHLTQVVLHVATLMPTKERDPSCNDKFRHIGNDFVWIVFNESGSPFCRTTVFVSPSLSPQSPSPLTPAPFLSCMWIQNEKVPFLKVCIVVTPLDCGINSVEVHAEQEADRIPGLPDSFQITDHNLSLYVRQIAIHANLAFRQQFETAKRSPADCLPFVSNWVERLRHMKRLKSKLASSHVSGSPAADFESSASSSGGAGGSASHGHRPRSLTTATRDMIVNPIDGPDSEYPDDFTTFTG